MKTKFLSAFSLPHQAEAFKRRLELLTFALLAAPTLLTTAPRASAQTGPGSALSFDGVDDHVVVPHTSALNPYPLTITAWIKTAQTAGSAGLVNKYVSNSGNGYQLFLLDGNVRAWYFRDLNNRVFTMNTDGLNGGFVADGQWHHLAFAVDTNGGRLYVDGTLKDSLGWTGSRGPTTTTQELSFSRYPGESSAWYFKGLLDEVALWNIGLTNLEIQAIMHVPLNGTEPGLLGYWRFNEGNGTAASDATTNGFTGTLINGPLWVVSTAPIWPGPPDVTTLSATNIARTSVTLQGAVNPSTAETFAWFEWGATTNYGNLTTVTNLGSGSNLVPVSAVLTGLVVGATHHFRLAATNEFGLTPGQNGTFTTLPAVPAALVTTLPAANIARNSALLQGTVNPLGSETTAWFEWGTTTNYGNSIGLTNVGSGISPVPITGTLTGLIMGVTYHVRVAATNDFGMAYGADAAFQIPAALLFDGVDDYVVVPHTNALNAYPLTITAWINTTQTHGSPGLVNKYVSNSGNGYQLFLVEGNVRAWYFCDPENRIFTMNTDGLNGGFVADGQWHHVAFVVGSDGGHLCVDGIEKDALAWTGTAGPTTTTQELSFARYPIEPSTLSGYFHGVLDEVAIWNTARSWLAIRVSMHKPLTGTEPGLLGYWRLNEGTNTSALDTTANGRPGTLVNGPSWVASTAPIQPGPPWVITLSAANLTRTSAMLQGTVHPIWSDTFAWFEWGATTNYGNVRGQTNLGSGGSRISASHEVMGLGSGTTWHCRLVASNGFGLVGGRNETFTTLPPALVTTLPATGPTPNGGTLQGTVNPGGAQTLVWFEWGTNASYGDSVGLTHVGSGTNLVPVSTVLTGLVAGTTYHYRLVASNEFGLARGSDQMFTPPPFTDLEAGLPGVDACSVAWGDYDNDGDLDILLTGSAGYDTNGNVIHISRVYCSDGGTFTDLNAGLPGVASGAVAWGDYDNDGDLDFLLTGWSDSGFMSRAYRNDDGTFTEIDTGLPGVAGGSVAWGDYDNDGDLDILLTGSDELSDSGLISRVYRNDGGTFTDLNAGLPGVASGAVAWGDYDNDGDLDCLLTGSTHDTDWNVTPISCVYRNDGGTFTEIYTGLPGVLGGSVAWGDYDNDGDLDLLVTGNASEPNTGPDVLISRVYRNDGGTFTDLNAGLPGVARGEGAWGDYDNDGDLDILLTGWSDGDYISRVYRNNGPVSNTPPVAPSGLRVAVSNQVVTLSWDAASDGQTPPAGLNYNVRVGSTPGGGEVVAPHADGVTGWRRLPQLGNAQPRLFASLTNLPPGLYYWSVQAVDTAWAGSRFADERRFYLGPPKFLAVELRPPAQVSLHCGGTAGLTYTLETSTNLATWTARTNLVAGPEGLFDSLENYDTNHPQRFYRLRWP